VRAEAIVTLTDWERRHLADIERELTAGYPKLARLLNAPGRWRRLRWGPRRIRLTAPGIGVLVALCVVSVILGTR
jgi:hypothetical protein